MKKILLSIAAIAVIGGVNAQIYSASDAAAFGSWTPYDLDGDGNDWQVADLTGAGTSLDAQGECAISASWISSGALTPDNIFVSPVIDCTAPTGVILEWGAGNVETTASGWYEEHYAVYVITTADLPGLATGTFPTPVFETTLAGGETMYTETVDITAQAAGNADVYLVFRHYNCTDENFLVIDDLTVTGQFASTDENELTVTTFPNPAVDVLNISVNAPANNVAIYSLDGQLIKNEQVNSTTISVDVADLTPGVYLYEVTTTEGLRSRNTFVKK